MNGLVLRPVHGQNSSSTGCICRVLLCVLFFVAVSFSVGRIQAQVEQARYAVFVFFSFVWYTAYGRSPISVRLWLTNRVR